MTKIPVDNIDLLLGNPLLSPSQKESKEARSIFGFAGAAFLTSFLHIVDYKFEKDQVLTTRVFTSAFSDKNDQSLGLLHSDPIIGCGHVDERGSSCHPATIMPVAYCILFCLPTYVLLGYVDLQRPTWRGSVLYFRPHYAGLRSTDKPGREGRPQPNMRVDVAIMLACFTNNGCGKNCFPLT
jgi:hypothetical protein